MTRSCGRIDSVTLDPGQVVACGKVVNASGLRTSQAAAMAGVELPVEPRKRFSWTVSVERPFEQDLPLTIKPFGVHERDRGGGTYLAAGHPDHDPAVDKDDFTMDHSSCQDLVWPALAIRLPRFEAFMVKIERSGHYACNTFDQGAIMDPHPEIGSFILLNGFSGHDLEQPPAMGHGTAERLTCGDDRALDLAPLNHESVVKNASIVKRAVI